jgi:hypothetical protein
MNNVAAPLTAHACRFSHEVLEQRFKSSNFASFVRQVGG